MKFGTPIARRAAIRQCAAMAVLLAAPGVAAAKRPPVAGFEPEPWFADTTGDLNKDLAAARNASKFLVLLWEQQSCHYCHEMHAVNFKEPDIVAFGRQHFHTIQMDLWGDRDFVDFDGKIRKEAAIAKAQSVRGTPVTVFFDPATGKEGFRMPGYAPPALNLAVYYYVAEKAYETASLREWIKARQQ